MGRPVGARNKDSKSVRGAFLDCFEAIGGIRHLQEWAISNPTDFYKLLSKLMGTEIKISGEVHVTTHEKTIDWLNTTIDSIALTCETPTLLAHNPWKGHPVRLEELPTYTEVLTANNRPLSMEDILNAR
jgi:hypothetical protein